MVLEQKMSAMSEHNTQSGGGSDAQFSSSSHSKKMSLATKLKKQRRIRQSGSTSPVPNEQRPSASKSPVRDTVTRTTNAASTNMSNNNNSHSQRAEESKAVASTSTHASDNNAPKKAASSSTGSSVGASLLHNKRRAMQLAKNRRSQDPKPVVDMSAKNEDNEEEEEGNDANAAPASHHINNSSSSKSSGKASAADAYAPYYRKTPASKPVLAEPKPAPSASEASLASSNDHDVTPVPSAESEESEARSSYSTHSKVAQSRPMDHHNHEEVVPWDLDEGPTETPAAPRSNNSSVVAMPLPVDDSDRFSQVSLGRSVVSNGVVDYDESIMNLARLDNFRSKTNQTRASQSKANYESQYPGRCSSPAPAAAVPSQISAQVEDSHHQVHAMPSSAAKAAASRQWNPVGGGETNTSTAAPAPKPSWRARSPSPVVKDTVTEQPAVTASTAGRGKFSRQPSWMKRNNAQEQDEAPASPTPSNANSRPVSPARSTFSTASYRHDSRPTSPFLNMPKFSSSRSDIGVNHVSSLPMPSTARSWKASPVVKKPTFSGQVPVPPRQEDVCPVSPSPSHVSDVESAPGGASANVPKAKAWSAKKQALAPVWARRSSSSGALEPQQQAPASSPKRQSINKSWMKPTNSEAKETPQKITASPAPMPRHFSQSPSIPKPVTTSGTRQMPVADDAEKEIAPSSPRRRSASPAPSWVKSRQEAEPAAEKPPSVPTTKSWAANKQTPAWMKKAPGAEEQMEKPPVPVSAKKSWSAKKTTPSWMQEQANSESDKVSTPSPRRNSAPSWMKPGHANSSGHHEKSPQLSKEKLVAVASPQTPAWKARTSSPGDQKQSPSQRSQSWKPASPPLCVDKSTVGGPPSTRKARHSLGGPAAAVIKTQRSPSPSVAQLQEQIFVTKLGVGSASQKNSVPRRATKGPSSPSPQVKELQKIIFSPDKGKGEQEEKTSPAAGWWKRIPNAPEVQPENCESPSWKHETSSTCGEYTDVSPSPTMMSEPPLTSQKCWKPPQQGSINPGTPSWLRDVASFHSASSPKLPSQPPVWQEAPEEPASGDLDDRSSAPRASPISHKPVDEESSELKVMTPTSTTSRDDSSSAQPEDTKSLIQMAADSVLVIDYEQAMQRAVVDSKSDDEDESVGNSADDALPSELPLEFQKALTFEDKREEEADAYSVSDEEEDLPTSEDAEIAQDVSFTGPGEEAFGNELHQCSVDVKPHTSARSSSPKECSQPDPQDQPQNEVPGPLAPMQLESTKRLDFDEPCEFGAASESVPQDRVGSSVAPFPNQESRPDEIKQMEEDAATQNDRSTSFCPSDTNLSGIEYDENGFPCGPVGNGAEASFGHDDFHADAFHDDAFGSEPWAAGLGDEKKDEVAEVLQYWAPEVDALNDSSEWANRDPGLDSIATQMNSPEPVATEKVIATAERVLRKWSDSPQLEANIPGGNYLAPDDGRVNISRSSLSNGSQSPEKQASDAMWDVDQFAGQSAEQKQHPGSPPPQVHDDGAWGSPRLPQPTVMADPMWGSEQAIDATWGLSPQPDPFSAPNHFDAPATNERPRGDVFDPFGDEEDELTNFHTGKLFAEPTESFVAVDSFAPPTFAPQYSHEDIPLKPVSQEEMDGHYDLQMI